MKILFLHPDLGIGGAERLVVDAAIAMQQSSHQVDFVTAHHDTNHCFKETSDGTLPVTVVGDSLPRSIFGKCNALCAYFRMIVAAFYIVFFSKLEFDVIFCDQISAPIPILKLSKKKIIFYCHFPDQLLTKRENLLKKVYRAPIDWIEQWTTGMADVILVNSKFTADVFRQTFPKLTKLPIKVIYPSINFSSFDVPVEGDLDLIKLKDITTVFLSINRYERKKNLSLAIYALAELYKQLELKSPLDKKNVYLIMGGGYDELVEENKQYYKELEKLAADLHVDDKVSLRKSLSDSQKHSFLHSCTAVIYTPENEHFGIVPLEAMYMYRPVIAANSGGPLETIVDDETGFLCEPNPTEFCSAMMKFVEDKSLAREMGSAGRRRVEEYFSFESFKKQLNNVLNDLHLE